MFGTDFAACSLEGFVYSRCPALSFEALKVFMFEEIQHELARLRAKAVRVSMDAEFEPEAGELVKVELGSAYWHLLPSDFLQLIQQLPDGAGAKAIKKEIERKAPKVWHGPAPEGSRDASP